MLRVQDFMNKNVKSIASHESADTALETMQNNSIHHLVVIDGGKLVGIVSARDLGPARDTAFRKGRTVEQVMHSDVICVAPEATVREAANKMRGRYLGCLCVLQKKRLCGIITTSDILQLLGKGFQRPIPKGQRPTRQRQKNYDSRINRIGRAYYKGN